MTKKQSEIRKQMRDMNYQIFLGLVRYLTGKKWCGAKYSIDAMKKNTRDIVIRVDGGYKRACCDIYFGYGIRIATRLYTVDYENKGVFYTYYGTPDTFELPDDIDDYINTTKVFLIELLRHTACIQMHYPAYPSDGYFSCSPIDLGIDKVLPKKLNEELKSFPTYEDLLLYEYSYEDIDVIKYMIAVFKSKKFKRGRGDNK